MLDIELYFEVLSEKRLISLFKSGSISVYSKSDYNETVLQLACLKGYSKLVTYLLSLDGFKFNVNNRDALKHTALLDIGISNIKFSDFKIILLLLLDNGANINIINILNETLITLIILNDDNEKLKYKKIKLLIDQGFSIRSEDIDEAKYFNYKSIVKLLVKHV